MGNSTLWLLAIGVNLVLAAYRLIRHDSSNVISAAFGSPRVVVLDSAIFTVAAPTESGGGSARDNAAARRGQMIALPPLLIKDERRRT